MKYFILLVSLALAVQGFPRNLPSFHTKLVKLPANVTTGEAVRDYLRHNRIAGGQLASKAQFPWMVRLWHSIGDGWWAVCGSSLLNQEWLLTAAHCVHEGENQFMMILGALNPDDASEAGRVELDGTNSATEHPNYDSSSLQNDLAVVKLPRAVDYTDTIQPLSLPSRSQAGDSFAGRAATAAGWGGDDDSDDTNNSLLKFNQLTVLTNAECQSRGWAMVDGQLCAGGDGQHSICSGDSGSPLFLDDGGKTIQIGIDSWGAGGCPDQMPSGFTRVTSYLDWISQTTGINIP